VEFFASGWDGRRHRRGRERALDEQQMLKLIYLEQMGDARQKRRRV